MSDRVTISTNASRLLRDWNNLSPAIAQGVRKGLARALLLTEENVRNGSQVKFKRESGLAGRLTSYVLPHRLFGLDAAIGFRKTRGFPYELSQEFGATAKPGGAMTMPVSPAARRWSESGGKTRNFPTPLFIPPHMSVLAERYKRGGGIKAIHYVLLKRLKPKLGFRKTVIASLPMISDEVERGAREGAAAA